MNQIARAKTGLWWWVTLATLALAVTGFAITGCETTETELTIFHTNDLHLHYRPAKLAPFGLGGVARLSTLLKQRRAKTGLSLTIDAGDWSEGPWYYNLDLGTGMLRLMNMLGYDAAALGNHDFLSGPDNVITTITNANAAFPVLAANLDMSKYARKDELLKVVPPYVIKQVGKLKVGIIGLTTFELLYDSYIAPVQITNIVDAATRVAMEVRPKVDVLIITSHNNIEANKVIAKAVPGVDAVISGHSHMKMSKPVMVTNAGRQVPVVESFQWANFLGELTLAVNPTTHAVRVKGWQLHPVSSELADDPVIAAYVDQQDHLLGQKYGVDVNQVVAASDIDMEKTDSWESPLGNLVVRAYRDATGADLSMEETSLTGVGLAKGDLTRMDLHDVIPHIYNGNTGKEWNLKVWNARGSDIQLVMTLFYTISSLTPFASPIGWLVVDNAIVIWDPGQNRPGGPIPIRSIQIGGRALNPSSRYRVAISEGMLGAVKLANEKFSLGVDLSQVLDTGVEAWQVVTDYAIKKKTLTLDELRVGSRVMSQSADLAIYSYSVSWDKSLIRAEVENLGLATAAAAELTCYSGMANDPVLFGTPEQKWSLIGRVKIPSLKPNGTEGNTTLATVPWRASDQPRGQLALKCEVSLAGETYLPNNAIEKLYAND